MKEEYFFNQFDLSDINIFYCGRAQCAPGLSWGPAVRSHYLLTYIVRGKGIYKVDKKKKTLSANEIFLIEPDTRVYYEADKKNPWEYIWAAFHGPLANSFFKKSGTSSIPYLSGSAADIPEYKSLMEEMFTQTLKNSVSGEMNSLGTLLKLLPLTVQILLRETSAGAAVGGNWERRKGYTEAALRFIHGNFAEHIDVSVISRHVGLERSYFTELFRRETGVSPGKYLFRHRMSQAKRMLETGLINVEEAAYSVGYRDNSSFSRAFQRHYNMPPSAVSSTAK